METQDNIKYGRRTRKRKVEYDMNVFGDWVRYQREHEKDWTLQEAADAFNANVLGIGIKGGKPITASGWRLRFEQLGKERHATPGAHARKGKVDRHHCKAIALTLGLNLEDVEKQAGFIPTIDGIVSQPRTQVQANRPLPNTNSQSSHTPRSKSKTILSSLQIDPLAEKCLQIQAQKQNLSLAEYTKIVLEQQALVMDPYDLRKLLRVERNQLMALQAEKAAPLYEADLALPVEERELTAFTAISGDTIYDDTP